MRLFVLAALFSVIFIFNSQRAMALILLEPYAGYEFGSIKETEDFMEGYSYSHLNKATITGPAVGARAGISKLGFFGALDMKASGFQKYKVEGEDSLDTNQFNLGLTGGYDFPVIPLRAWVGYIFLDNIKASDKEEAENSVEFKGSALKIGAGFTGFPIVHINVEYCMHFYNKMRNRVAGELGDWVDLSKKVKNNAIFINVSAPFDLL